MRVMKRETWPAIMAEAKVSVLILAPWLDDDLITELFAFLPPVEVRILFPRSTLQKKGLREFRNLLRQAMDINFEVEIRVIDEELAACLVEDDENFFFSETYQDLLTEKGGIDAASGIAYAHRAWDQAEPWE
jgi:hypothetical protein